MTALGMFVWCGCVYGLGYMSQNQPSKLSFNFRAPRYLSVLCGRPLPDRTLDFSPTVLQVAGLVATLALTLGLCGVPPKKLWGLVLLIVNFVTPLVCVAPLVWRGIKGKR